MLNRRTLALAVVATGAGAVLFLSTGQNVDSSPRAPFEPVPAAGQPVQVPATVTEAPVQAKPVMAVEEPPPPSTPASAPAAQPAPKRHAAVSTPARKVAPRAATVQQAPAQQQPQPADTEPNGTGGWQLPACYEESCVAPLSAQDDPAQGTGTEALNAGPLGLLGIVNAIPALLGGH